MSTETESEVTEIIAERLQIDLSAFNDGTRFEEDLDAESLNLVEMAEAIEATLGVHIPDDDLAELETVGEVKAYVVEHTD